MMQSVSLTQRCRGRWPEIMAQLAPYDDLLKAIERGPRRQGWCPAHRGRNGDAFRVFEDFRETGGAVCNTCGKFRSGFQVLMWLNGWDEVRTGRELQRFLKGERIHVEPRKPPVPVPACPVAQSTYRPTRERLLQLWEQCYPLTHAASAPVRRYFAHRGLSALELEPFDMLRCHPQLAYYDFETRKRVGYFPTLVAYVVGPAGELVALHRTYLTSDGEKAPVSKVKKLLTAADATASGGAVRLHPPGSVLCTCEGLENGLTAVLRNRMPMWPATSTSLLGTLVLPPQVRHVVTWGDFERPQRQPDGSFRQPGLDAAKKLAARLRAEGRTVEMLFPTPRQKGVEKLDWNQVLQEYGLEAIPKLSPHIRMLPTALRLTQLRHGTVIRG
jgi:putative DNA primase/helicase